MNKLFRSAIAAAAFVTLAPATALATEVIVVNAGYVINNAEATKDMVEKLQKVGQDMGAELDAQGIDRRAFQESAVAFLQSARDKTREQLEADANLRQTRDRLNQQNREIRIREAEFELTTRHTMAQIYDALAASMEDVRKEKGAALILDANSILGGDETVNATQAVLDKLNSRLPTVNVERQRVPAEALSGQ